LIVVEFIGVMLVLGLFVLLGLTGLRLWDARSDQKLLHHLKGVTPTTSPRFDTGMLGDLPDPAARFFRFAIKPGTTLTPVVEITMGGTLSLGGKESPKPQSMTAQQILAPPFGFLWQIRLGGPLRITGSEAYAPDQSWSRFRLLNLVPVGRVSHNPDHLRSAFGRMIGEGLFWSPAAFLPAAHAGWDDINWGAVDENTAVVTVRHNGLEQRASLTVAKSGQPLNVVFDRWSNENADRTYRLQPFGGDLAEFAEFGGYTLPTRVTGGNHYGTKNYNPFYKARVKDIRFL